MNTTVRHVARRATRPATHPLENREKRTALNYAFRRRGVPVKVCSKCLTVKSVSAFNRYVQASDGLSSYCRVCTAARHAYRQDTDPDYRQRLRGYALASKTKNQRKVRQYAKERASRIGAANREKNRDKVRDPNTLKRCVGQCQRVLPETEFRLDRRNNDGLRIQCKSCADATRRARAACAQAFGPPLGSMCYLCGGLISGRSDVQVDHLVPQSHGGPDTADNVRWTHGPCNRQRFTKPLTPEQLRRAEATGPIPTVLNTNVSGDQK